MKKNNLINKFIFALGISAMVFACDDDKGDSASAGFAGIGSSYAEADGTGTVFIPFRDGSVSESDITVDGSATEGADADYTVSFADDGITVTVNDDDKAEHPETVRFTIAGTSGASNRTHVLNIISDDPGYMNVVLAWEDAVDLDLISWYYHEDTEEWEDISFSDPGNNLAPIDWTDPDGLYGFTYNYYAGSDDEVPFTVTFTPTGVTLEGADDPLVFNATYTLDNVDPSNVQIEQTVVKTGTDFSDFTEIEVPEEGSRKAEILNKLRKSATELYAKRGKHK